jgi:hypothetical protein
MEIVESGIVGSDASAQNGIRGGKRPTRLGAAIITTWLPVTISYRTSFIAHPVFYRT